MSANETVTFTVRMPRAMAASLDKLADHNRGSRNREILLAAQAHLDANRKRGRR